MERCIKLRRWPFYLVIGLLLIAAVTAGASLLRLEKARRADGERFLNGFCFAFFQDFSNRFVNEVELDTVTADELEARWLPLTRAASIWGTAPSVFQPDSGVVGWNLTRLEYDVRDIWWRVRDKGEPTAEQRALLLALKEALPELREAVFEGAKGALRPECMEGTYFTNQFLRFFERIYGES